MTIRGWLASSYYARTRNSAWAVASMLFLACAPSYTRAQAASPASSKTASRSIPQPATEPKIEGASIAAAARMTPEELIKGLDDRGVSNRLANRDELIKRGAAAVRPLVAAMRDYRRRERFIQILERMGPPAVPALLEILPDPVLGGQAGTALARASSPASAARIPDFLRCVRVEATRISCGVALVRAAKGGKAHVAAIVAAAKDSSPEVRALVCAALAEVGGLESVKTLRAALADKVPSVRAAAAAALGRLGPAAAPARAALKAALKDPDADVRFEARRALKGARD